MMHALVALNWYAVVVAAVAYFVLGGLWFSPPLFGSGWAHAIGFTRPEAWKPGSFLYLAPLLASLSAAIVTAVLARATGSATIADGVVLGFIVSLGYSVAIAGVDAVSPQNPEPLKLFLITGSYHLVGLTIVAVVVTIWR